MKSDLEGIKKIFEQMSVDNWDTMNELTWGFFFVDKDEAKLKNVFGHLKDKEYRLVSLDKGDDELWTLQVSKRETLTADKLHKRNLAFNELADYCGVELYDGWDVEK
jgi:hypothetical protein